MSHNDIDEVYHDRNLLAIGFCAMLKEAGEDAGWFYDDSLNSQQTWPLVWTDPENGDQMGWHVTPDLADLLRSSPLPNQPYAWDGHGRKARNQRIESVVNA